MNKEHHDHQTIRRLLRRLDDWTLEVFNPYYPSDHR